jgi:membrane fusion protein (multidrug efflux system)
MKKNLLAVIVPAALAVVGGAGYWLGTTKSPNQQPAAQAAKPPAASQGITVEASKVVETQLPLGIAAVGSLRSEESVILRPEIAGRVSEILFTEGQRVTKGQPLIRLDSSVQRAELEQVKANLVLSKSKFDRAVDLQNKGFISSQARDEADNNYRVSQAAVELATARLSKLDLKAPFSGVMGLRHISVGDYVKDGQDIANLEQIDSLKADFRLPEIFLKQVAAGQNLQITLDAIPNRFFNGKVLAINPLLDANGRSIVVRAQVANPKNELRPGMFARVRLLASENRPSLVIPEESLFPVGDDKFVYKVVDGRAQRQKVDIGQRLEGKVEILSGLAKEDLVVTAGQLKLRDGAQVSVAAAPEPQRKSAAGASPVTPATRPAIKTGGS